MKLAAVVMAIAWVAACAAPTSESTTPAPAPPAPAPSAPAPTPPPGDTPAPNEAPPPDTAGKERTCPEAWYLNAMPGTVPDKDSPPREYLVVAGQRRELAEFDMEWIKANCPVNKPETVH
jgi:hypothetical protein